jgi:hypothetical protein
MTEYRHPLAVNFARASELTSLSKQTLRRLAKSGAPKDNSGDQTKAGYSLHGVS